jgi:L-ascorbate metabolism protein UlaG (beta-lactamase superfamily)
MSAFHYFLVTLKYASITLLVLSISIWLFIKFDPVFGGEPDAASLGRMVESKQYQNGTFINLESTQLNTSTANSENFLSAWFFPPEDKNPSQPMPSHQFNQNQLTEGKFVWLGHSTLLINTRDVIIMTDPVFNRASPIPIGGSPFSMQNKTTIDDLPLIDVVIISHDHYDHLDQHAIIDLAPRVKHFFVPLGVKAHLRRWGIDEETILEFDWYQSIQYNQISLTFTPSRHFSGRGLDDQSSTLWGSWVINSENLNVYFSGDGGYSETFKQLGEKFGPFDIAFMENGAYSLDWAQIHMLPEETVKASIDLRAKVLFPIHWGKFDLALHPWDEPVKRLKKEAGKHQVTLATPMVGEVFGLDELPVEPWWESVR